MWFRSTPPKRAALQAACRSHRLSSPLAVRAGLEPNSGRSDPLSRRSRALPGSRTQEWKRVEESNPQHSHVGPVFETSLHPVRHPPIDGRRGSLRQYRSEILDDEMGRVCIGSPCPIRTSVATFKGSSLATRRRGNKSARLTHYSAHYSFALPYPLSPLRECGRR